MEDKLLSQIKHKYINFYFNEIKDKLPEINRIRKIIFAKKIILSAIYFMILLIFIIPFCSAITSQDIYASVYGIVYFSIIILAIIFSVLELLYKKSPYEVTSNADKELKKKFMKNFVNIFLEFGTWQNAITDEQDNFAKAPLKKRLKNHLIFNDYFWMFFDDFITGSYNNIEITMFETNTKLSSLGIIIPVTSVLIITILITFSVICIFVNIILFLECILSAFIFLIFITIKSIKYEPFQGVTISYTLNKRFRGHTFFHENSAKAKKFPFDKKKYQKVNLESVTFGKKYNVYSDNQIEAKHLFTTTFMERIENLSLAFNAKYIRGSFKDDKLILAIHTGKDSLAMGSDSKDTDAHTFEILFDEMISVLQIVDALKLNEHLGL